MTAQDDPFAFGERLLSILSGGRFVATYKYAVLLALLDLALEASAKSGAPPDLVTTEQLAEKVIELCWPHTRAFTQLGRAPLQSSGADALILRRLAAFRAESGATAVTTIFRARGAVSRASWAKLVADVEWTLISQPLPRLQRIGNSDVEFLYTIGWNLSDIEGGKLTKRQVRARNFDNRVHFQLGAAQHLVRLGGMVRPLVQRDWTACVARLNKLPIAALDEFLFGGLERRALDAVRPALIDLQDGRCFFCDDVLEHRAEVDHFVPWSRHPNNAIENLVVAHSVCNSSKSDYLPDCDHVKTWMERNVARASDLSTAASLANWESDHIATWGKDASVAVARTIYLKLPSDYQLWSARAPAPPQRPTVFAPIDHHLLATVFP